MVEFAKTHSLLRHAQPTVSSRFGHYELGECEREGVHGPIGVTKLAEAGQPASEQEDGRSGVSA